MANTGIKGVDVRQTGSAIIIRASLKDSMGNKVTSGTTSLYLYELQDDGTLKSYDWSGTPAFKTTALGTETVSMTHRTGNNGTTNTGIWTYAITPTGFTTGAVYIAVVSNTNASPPQQEREFQYGSDQGDLTTTAGATGVAYLKTDVTEIGTSTTAASNLSATYAAFETGTAQSGSGATSIKLRAGASAVNDYYKDQAVFLISGTGAGQTNRITAYDGTSKVATVETTWATTPSTDTVYFVIGRIG